MLENYSLGLSFEKHFPEEQGGVEAWVGYLGPEHMVVVFYTPRGYTDGHGVFNGHYMISVRPIPMGNPVTRKDYFHSPGVGAGWAYKTFVPQLDILSLKCILLEHGFIGA